MKLTKKLLPALGMLALSACMLVTSTFAWFATNMNVKATGMTVTAKGEQIYLQIIKESEDFTPGANQLSASATKTHNPNPGDGLEPVNIQLLPTSVRTAGADSALEAYNGTSAPAWVSAIGTSNTDGTAIGGVYSNVTNDANDTNNNGKYFLKNSFYIRLDPTAGGLTANALRVSSIDLATSITDATDKNFIKSLSVLVVCTIGTDVRGDLWNYSNGTSFAHARGSETLSNGNFTVTDKSAKVDVYVFFDGDNGACTLAELAKVASATYTVDVNFTVAAAQQNP